MTQDQERASYQGTPQSHDLPGTYELAKTLQGNFPLGAGGEFVRIRLATSSVWWLACPQLRGGERARVPADAVARRIDIRIVDPAAGDFVYVADEEIPGNNFKGADPGAPVVRKDYAPHHEVQDIWIQTSGILDLQFSTWFDLAIPLAELMPTDPQP